MQDNLTQSPSRTATELTNREMQHINVLAGEIGFRVAATEGERRAADYIEQELRSYQLQEVRMEPFPSAHESVSGFFPYLLTALGSSLLAPFLPRLGLGGLLGAPAGLIGEMRANRGPVTRLLRKGTSQNVIGVLHAREERKARVVLMAHYDSVRVRSYMRPRDKKRKRSPRQLLMPLLGLSYLTAVGASIVGLNARRTGNRRLERQARSASGLAGTALLAGMTPLLAGQLIRGFDGEGANDNASGVSVLLSLAEQMSGQPLANTEVWFVATGSEETGLNGARALIEQHTEELKAAYFFAIDTVGAGKLHYTTHERFTRSSEVPHEVIEILVKASERGQHSALPMALKAGATDASAALDRRYKGASICCLIKEGEWPEINWPTDVRTYIEPETPPKVTAFVRDILDEIDQRVCYNRPAS